MATVRRAEEILSQLRWSRLSEGERSVALRLSDDQLGVMSHFPDMPPSECEKAGKDAEAAAAIERRRAQAMATADNQDAAIGEGLAAGSSEDSSRLFFRKDQLKPECQPRYEALLDIYRRLAAKDLPNFRHAYMVLPR